MSDFWTKRRAAAQAEAQAEQAALEARAAAEQVKTEADLTDAELLAEYELPDPATMDKGADFSAFMRDTVPQRLRSLALRRLWRVNPVLANLDGLVDYGEDYTDAATCVKDLVTDYQVGKGMLAHVQEMARQALAEAEAAGEDSPVEDATEALVASSVTPGPDNDARVRAMLEAREPAMIGHNSADAGADAAALAEGEEAAETPGAPHETLDTSAEAREGDPVEAPAEAHPPRHRMTFHFTEGPSA